MEPKDLAAYVGAATGVSGLILGVYNAVSATLSKRVKLLVTPQFSVFDDFYPKSTSMEIPRGSFVAVEVVNKSAFPVTISEVGLELLHRDRTSLVPAIETTLPRKLEARASVVIYTELGADQIPITVERVYVTTQCKHTAYGGCPALTAFKSSQRKHE